MQTKTHLMNYKKLIFALLALPLMLVSCQDDDTPFGDVLAPTNLEATIDVADDLSGNVSVTPTAEYALTFHVYFKPDLDPCGHRAGGICEFPIYGHWGLHPGYRDHCLWARWRSQFNLA